jgi:hypothetical protein
VRVLAISLAAFLAPGISVAATAADHVSAPHAATASAASGGTAPTKVAWFDASRPTAIAPAAPMPGVGPKDVVVEGLTINTALLPISLPIPTIREVTAFTALQFTVPDGSSAGGLTLHLTGFSTAAIDGKLPSGVTPIACPATSGFKAGGQQPLDAAPKYDCSKRSTVGQLSGGGKTVTFPGISRLADGNRLSVVILPGSLGLERLVFSPPGKGTLSLLDFSTPPDTTAPPVTEPSTPVTPAGGHPSGGSVPSVPLPPAGGVPGPAASQPVIAPPTPAIVRAALDKPDDHRERISALGMLVALVVVTAWTTLTDRGKRTAEMGIGRFRSQRLGPPPTI